MKEHSMKANVVVIGGGASGMMAAIAAAKGGCSVVILEQNNKLGKKIYATGNGKCNLTNLIRRSQDYRGEAPEFAEEVLAKVGVEEVLAFFSEMGLTTTERNGYVYPRSEQAQSVVAVLEYELRRYGVKPYLSSRVTALNRTEDRFIVAVEHIQEPVKKHAKTQSDAKEIPCFEGTITADAVILATGGIAGQNLGTGELGYEFGKRFGHRMVSLKPALVALDLKDEYFKKASGVRLEAGVTLCTGSQTYRENGEVVLTDYGISGIPIMQLSRFAEKNSVISLNFFPEMTTDEVEQMLSEHFHAPFAMSRSAEEALCGMLPDKLLWLMMEKTGITREFPAGKVKPEQLKKLSKLCTATEIAVTGTRDFMKAQVTAGGIAVSEVSPDTMESKLVPNLYLTGELLDIDGTCGGYNLQWAWSTGIVAGRAVADKLGKM